MNSGLVWLLLPVAAETLAVWGICALPDKRYWKMYLAAAVIVVSVGIAVAVPVHFAREIRAGDAANAAACDRAEALLAAGKRQQLAQALDAAFLSQCSARGYAAAAGFFRQTLDKVGGKP